MKSKVYSQEIIVKIHTHKASDVYYPCVFQDQAGREQNLLFTAQDIEDAKTRAIRTVLPERYKPWWKIW